jgi:hypothetical protein
MAAPKGNKFWEQRAKHGRDKIFETPELMLSCAKEYFHWCDENPWLKYEAIKSGDMCGKLVAIPTPIPYTIEGLCGYLGCNKGYFNDFEKALLSKVDETSKDFSVVITCIRETIYQQKFTGATVGAFNSSIIARDLGLTDKQDVTSGGDKITDRVVQIEIVPRKEHKE